MCVKIRAQCECIVGPRPAHAVARHDFGCCRVIGLKAHTVVVLAADPRDVGIRFKTGQADAVGGRKLNAEGFRFGNVGVTFVDGTVRDSGDVVIGKREKCCRIDHQAAADKAGADFKVVACFGIKIRIAVGHPHRRAHRRGDIAFLQKRRAEALTP